MLKLLSLLRRKRVSSASDTRSLYSITPNPRTLSSLLIPQLLKSARRLNLLANGTPPLLFFFAVVNDD